MNETKALVVARSSRRRHLRRSEREQIVALWSESGLSAEEVAQHTGVSRSSLWRWKHQCSTRSRPAVPRVASLVEGPPPISGGLSVAEVMTPGATVRLFAAATPAWAGQLIRELNRC
jgi:predicted DNA-binding transcriptional regulator AlpA